MQDNSILLDALGGLFNGIIHKKPKNNSKELSFSKYINLSLSLGCVIIEKDKKENIKKRKEFILTQIPKKVLDQCRKLQPDEEKKLLISDFFIIVKTLIDESILLKIDSNYTIEKIKLIIEYITEEMILDEHRIIFEGKQLEDKKKLIDYNIQKESILHLVLRIRGDKIKEFHLPNHLLDPKFDYDFSKIDDKGKKFKRGGLEYKRPCGWKRYGLKVNGKYKDDKWLNQNDNSINDSEWAVCYYGIKVDNTQSIIEYGFKNGEKNSFGIGIYCTPNIEIAERYSSIFINPVSGNKYRIVFQNRVRTSAIHRASEIGGNDDLWYVSDGSHIRPYSICVKQIY